MNKTSRTSKTSKMLYRRRVSIKWLERFGIKRGDTAIIAFDGDVKMGELGYFEIEHCSYGNYNQFAFVCEPDSSCYQLLGESQAYGICLREKEVCRGNHKGTPYGRVVRVERNGEEVTVGLKLRPFDERKSATLRQRNTLPGESTRKDKKKQTNTKHHFQVGDYAWYAGMNKHRKSDPPGPFLVTKVVDMRGAMGWDADQLVSLKGMLPSPSTHLIYDRETTERERARRTQEEAEKLNVKLSIHNGRLRIAM